MDKGRTDHNKIDEALTRVGVGFFQYQALVILGLGACRPVWRNLAYDTSFD